MQSTFGDDVFTDENGQANKTYLMAKTMGWTMDSCLSQTNLIKNGQLKTWKTKWNNKNWKAVSVNLEFSVEKTTDSETKVDVKAIDASIDDAFLPEVQPLIEKCIEVNEPAKFFNLFETYLRLHYERVKYFKDVPDVEYEIKPTTGEFRVTFTADGPLKQPLARLQWSVAYEAANDTFHASYRVGLTKEGEKVVQEYNFPEDLVNKGFVDHWDAKECINNLRKMMNIEENSTTPVKRSRKN